MLKHGTNHPRIKGIQVSSNEKLYSFQKGSNLEKELLGKII
jgi:hypothetical protein